MTTTKVGVAISEVDAAIDAVTVVGNALRLAVSHLDAVESQRAVEKLDAMRRLTATENLATPGKNFTASAAADFAQFDEDYAVYTERRADAARRVMGREHDLAVAKLRAEWAIALFKAGAGVEA